VSVDLPQVEAAVAAYAAARARLAEQAQRQAAALVEPFGAWWDTAAVTLLAARIAAAVQAAQRQTAALTDAYLARVATLIAGRRVGPVGRIDVAGLRGVQSADVYGRVADTYRYQLALGAAEPQARARAVLRAETAAGTDTTLAVRAQARKFMVVREVDGFRRIIRPELSAGGTCGLCIAAADRTYHRAELLPIHDRCNCDVLPVINGVDPGRNLNAADLAALYEAAGSTAAAALKRVRVAVHDHGELGPVLRERGHDFRGPEQVAAS
jgi:hypothetical protein